MVTRNFFKLALALLIACALGTPAEAADKLKFGMLRVPNVLFVGLEKGFFTAEGLEVEVVFFRSGAELVPSLSTGQIDIAATSPGAALYNAIAQGVNAVIVADYSVLDPGQPSGDANAIVVRKDLIDSGRFKSSKDLKGMTMAITARGQVTHLFANMFLKSGGLTEKDVRIVNMPYPDMLPALQGKAVDVAVFIDPFVTIAAREGFATRYQVMSDLVPGLNLGVVMYGDRVAQKDRELGMRFMRGFHRANSYVRQLLTKPEGRKELAPIYQKYIPLDSAAMYETVGLTLSRESLVVRTEGDYGLRWQLKWYTDLGLVPTQPDLQRAVDNSFATAAGKGM